MKHIRTIIIIPNSIVLIIILFGCNKNWLDAKPSQDLAVPTTLQDCQALMDNSDELNKSFPGLGEVASDDHYVTETDFQTLPPYEKNAYTWTSTNPYRNILDWTNTFRKVFICNIVLESLSKISPHDSNEQVLWNNIRGQALFTRSKAFYEAAQIFCPPFSEDSALFQLGIPLRLESNMNIPSTRTTLKQTYDQIIRDLEEAVEILPITSTYKTRASKPATLGLLARIFLTMGNYQKAGELASACLEIYSTLVDYNSLPSILFPVVLFNSEVIYHNSTALYGSITFLKPVDSLLFSSYSTDDLRRSVFFDEKPTGAHFYGNYSGGALLFGGIATDEIYLIRAECYARMGNISLAMQDLNTLLTKRWNKSVPYPKYNANGVEEALRIILNERRKELLFRGLRWSDLRRLNKDPRFAMTLSRKIGSIKYIIDPNSYRYTFPIPDDIIEQTGMTQNTGW